MPYSTELQTPIDPRVIRQPRDTSRYLPPLAPPPPGPDQNIAAENQAKQNLGKVSNSSFNEWYKGLKPEDIAKIAPPDMSPASTRIVGPDGRVTGTGGPVAPTADELMGRQRAAARQHFEANVLNTLPEYQEANSALQKATLNRATLGQSQAPLTPPLDPRLQIQQDRNTELQRHNKATEKEKSDEFVVGELGKAAAYVGGGISNAVSGVKDIAKTYLQGQQRSDLQTQRLDQQQDQFDTREKRLENKTTPAKPVRLGPIGEDPQWQASPPDAEGTTTFTHPLAPGQVFERDPATGHPVPRPQAVTNKSTAKAPGATPAPAPARIVKGLDIQPNSATTQSAPKYTQTGTHTDGTKWGLNAATNQWEPIK